MQNVHYPLLEMVFDFFGFESGGQSQLLSGGEPINAQNRLGEKWTVFLRLINWADSIDNEKREVQSTFNKIIGFLKIFKVSS